MAKVIISTTYSDTYLYFLPITVFCWNKLNVDVICFMPSGRTTIKKDGNVLQGVYPDGNKKMYLINETIKNNKGNLSIHCFSAPEHKEATYSQLSRVFVSGIDVVDEDEVAFCSDIDMANFKLPPFDSNFDFTVLGSDLTPDTQYPVCYVSATILNWRKYFNPSGLTYQAAMDKHLGHIECEGFRGNYWSFEQELIFNTLQNAECKLLPRSNGQNQFAQNRYDRDDQFILDRLNPDTIDFHMHRPGYEEKNFEIILTILKYHFPDESFDWLISYTNAYKELL